MFGDSRNLVKNRIQSKTNDKMTESQKVAIVTGGNKGLGLAICRGLAKTFKGHIYLTARNEEQGLKAVRELEQEGLTVQFHQLDIDDLASIKRLKEFLEQNHGRIDVLVNNAGIRFKSSSTEPYEIQAHQSVQTNYFGVKNTCLELFPLLASGARVVNVSSGAGFLSNIPGENLKARFQSPTLTLEQLDELMNEYVQAANAGDHAQHGWPDAKGPYIVSKVGLSALTRIQQRLNSTPDVAINHVHPGYVKTDMNPKGTVTTDEGAKSALMAALLPPGTDLKGQFIWSTCQVVDWLTGPDPDLK